MSGLRQSHWAAVSLLFALAAVACGGSTPTSPTSQTPAFSFSASPIEINFGFGVLNRAYGPSGDMRVEAQFYAGGPTVKSTDVFAPAAGVVTAVSTMPGSTFKRIDFSGAAGYRFYLTWLQSVTVPVGASVTAGQRIGVLGIEFRQGAIPVGLGLIDPTRTVGFARPERYGDEILRGLNALDYFDEPLKSTLLATIQQPGKGTLNYDMPGTLQGLWYLEGTPIADSARFDNRNSWLFFVHTQTDAGNGMRAIFNHVYAGGAEMSSEALGATDLAPSAVTPSTGTVKYQFAAGVGGWRMLLVQMINATTVRAETWDSYHSPGMQTFAFTSAARTYVR